MVGRITMWSGYTNSCKEDGQSDPQESDSRLGANRNHEQEMWQPSAKNGPFQGCNIYDMKDMQIEKHKDGTLHGEGRLKV